MMTFEPFDDRREGDGYVLRFEAWEFYVTINFDAATRAVREVFVRPKGRLGKGSTVERICDDVAVLLSLPLRAGMTPAELAAKLGRQVPLLPDAAAGSLEADARAQPASFVGAIVDLAVARQAELDAEDAP